MRASLLNSRFGRASLPTRLLLSMLLVCASFSAWSVEPETTREYALKAAFVFNFAKFIEWPAHAFASADAPIVVGVLGETPLAAALETVVKDRRINGRSVLVRRVREARELAPCHILFVSAADVSEFVQLRRNMPDSPLVTVGETSAFMASGGTISFLVLESKVRFEINIGAAERAGLKVSSQLQKLAFAVHRAQ
jgi:hypothetical protein